MIESGRQKETESNVQGEQVSVNSLSAMTGFPIEFIKKELLISQENISVDELRKSVLDYLQSAQKDICQ